MLKRELCLIQKGIGSYQKKYKREREEKRKSEAMQVATY